MTITLPTLLMAASAGVILLLGLAHLLFTFRGQRLHPREPAVMAAMRQALPRITRETTMWRAWVGFNASHSYGAILFGLVWAWLALTQPALLFGSPFLLVLGALLLAAYVHLAWRYWFSIPFRGIVLASLLYAAALAMSASAAPISAAPAHCSGASGCDSSQAASSAVASGSTRMPSPAAVGVMRREPQANSK